jgi:hypothetical protein
MTGGLRRLRSSGERLQSAEPGLAAPALKDRNPPIAVIEQDFVYHSSQGA